MSKTTCTRCGATYSATSDTCPACGVARVNTVGGFSKPFLIAFILIDTLLVAGIALFVFLTQ